MTASFASALAAARDAAGPQDYPRGALYLVATPIGNLADITLRALHVLSLVDRIACEDTRHSRRLLDAFGIERPLVAVHEHNEQAAAADLVARLVAGERVAFISDAGTPAISDPGARLVAAVRAAGLRAIPIPGASSVVAAISVSGLESASFRFAGFLPARGAARTQALDALRQCPDGVILLEAPHRIEALFEALASFGERPVTVARELTKQHEEVATLAARALPSWLAQDALRARGEWVLVLHAEPAAAASAGDPHELLRLLLAELPVSAAVRLATQLTPLPRNELYRLALEIQKGEQAHD